MAGFTQRLMFAVAIAWYGMEATRLHHQPSDRTPAGADQPNTAIADAARVRGGP